MLRNQLFAFVAAVRLLTRVPITTRIATTDDDIRRSVSYMPLVGMLIGIVAFFLWVPFGAFLPWAVSVLGLIAVTILLTGALHEDGLADTFDGIGGGHTRERALEIMRDSRIGTYGVLALMIVIGAKVATLASLDDFAIGYLTIAAHTASRASMVIAMWRTRPARDEGLGAMFADGPGVATVLVAWATSALPLLALWSVLGWQTAAAAGVGAVIGHLAIRACYQRKLGGYTGDTLGAVQQITELAMYLAATPILVPLL